MTQIKPAPASSVDATNERLKSLIERIERLDMQKADIAEDIKQVYAEGKGHGFDVKVMREVIRLRKMATDERQERETLLDTYLKALEMS